MAEGEGVAMGASIYSTFPTPRRRESEPELSRRSTEVGQFARTTGTPTNLRNQ